MKLPSFTFLITSAKQSLYRFPLTIFSAFVAVCVSLYLVEFNDDITNTFPYINILLTAALGIPLYFSMSVISTKNKLNLKWNLLTILGATIFLILIYFSLPNSSSTHNTSLPYIRYGVFNIIIHLVASFIPYISTHKLNGFWNYNKTLFIRVWVSILYSGFLYVGLILALSALDFLFKIEIHSELYFEFFIVIVGLFNTWFFVSGIPNDLDELESMRTYPKGLKVFSQFILLPLLILYMVILYVYGGKIIIQWEWPEGLVSYLISCVSILGILTLLLINPYGNLEEGSWIKKFSNIYYPSLFPLIILLFIAIWIRVDDYGITINRYVIVLLGIWLTIIAVFFSLRKTNIKFIPISLATILLLMSFGPWSMYSVSENSQMKRLKSILAHSNILKEGEIQNEQIWIQDSLPLFQSTYNLVNDKLLNDSIHNEVKSILDYLDDHHGFESIRPWFEQNIDSLITASLDSNYRLNEARIYMRSMGLEYRHRYKSHSNDFSYSSTTKKITNVSEYDYLYSFDRYFKNSKYNQVQINNIWYTNEGVSQKDQLFVLSSPSDSIVFELKPMINKLIMAYGEEWESDIAPSKMTVSGQSNLFKCKLEIRTMRFSSDSNALSVSYIEGDLLLKSKHE